MSTSSAYSIKTGLADIKRGATTKLVFANRPGEVYYSTISDVLRGIGQGQVAVSGTLARANPLEPVQAIRRPSTYPKTSTRTCCGSAWWERRASSPTRRVQSDGWRRFSFG